ncbi:MAG: bifunctional folylpolyglutamate synthase/dihydrofolate synthase [Rhodospirillales bacterium]|nr:bifunctional folylpolyglutamate synthase/dihydrofolate synthase [Rhodospirillales bacterium]MCB9996087.1 bifunctional folylpolyglutamate synthase/dihydrofolate synthase [Rhodospirillales bacterium]
MYTADAHHPNAALETKLQGIYTLRGDGTKVDLGFRPPFLELLQKLGNPHTKLPPVVHVAGTNGKGSVIAMLRAILEAAGYNVHTYTSPHLIKFNERITLSGRHITDEALDSLLDDVLAVNGDGPVTFFEITSALAFTAFSRNPADICLLETGLGGRLDCTNVIEHPLATIITRIGYDHMEFLGDTIEKIAAEKAGIMKAGAPCIIAPQEYEALIPFFTAKAKDASCPLLIADPVQGRPSALSGPHQIDNAATVLTVIPTLQQAGFEIDEEAIATGLRKVRWPARLQKLERPDLPAGAELWIDGGHNESAAKVLAAQAAQWQSTDQKPLHLVIGMMTTKDIDAFLAPLLPYAAAITCTAVPGESKAQTPETLAEHIKNLCSVPVFTEPDPQSALTAALTENTRILITGSLYLAGHYLALFSK